MCLYLKDGDYRVKSISAEIVNERKSTPQYPNPSAVGVSSDADKGNKVKVSQVP